MSNVAIDLTKTVKEIITTMKTAIDNLNTDVDSLKSEILLAAHPVGSYYISDKATDPGTLFGGTWKMLDPGLTLISQGKGTDKFGSFEFVAGQTYGERLHQLTVEEIPNLPLRVLVDDNLATDNTVNVDAINGKKWTNHWREIDNCIKCVNTKGNAHNNMPPSLAVYAWRRQT